MGTASGAPREEIVTKLAQHIDSFERYSKPHSMPMADMAARLASRLGLAQADINAIAEASLLHDIGLFQMSPGYVLKTGSLTVEERMDLWRHPIIGEQEMAKRGASRHAQLLVRWHHEWWNGTGYPDMLSFEDIPIGARIIRAVELFNALGADRPYRASLAEAHVREILRSSAGIECDPYVVAALIALLDELFPVASAPMNLDRIPANSLWNATSPGTNVDQPRSESFGTGESRVETKEPGVGGGVFAAALSENQIAPDQPLASAGVAPQSPEASQETPVEGYVESTPAEPLAIPVPANPNEATESTAPDSAPPYGRTEGTGDDSATVSASAPEGVGPSEPAHVAEPAPLAREGTTASGGSASIDHPEDAGQPGGHDHFSKVAAAHEHYSERVDPKTTPSPYGESYGPQSIGVQSGHRIDPVREPAVTEWHRWFSSPYSTKSLLGFEASVLRHIEFRSIAIAFAGWSRLAWYLKAWGRQIWSNDPRLWAAAVSEAVLEPHSALTEDRIPDLVQDLYVPGTRLSNLELRNWFGETDSWWLDNLRQKIDQLEPAARHRALLLGLQAGDYAQSFGDDDADLKRPLTTVFKELAGNLAIGFPGHPNNRAFNLPVEKFIALTRADLLYLNLPPGQAQISGAFGRSLWRESWIRDGIGAGIGDGIGAGIKAGQDANTVTDGLLLATRAQSKQTYLAIIDRHLGAARAVRKWAIECRDVGLASSTDIIELVKRHRPVRAIYSKDLTEVAGGMRHHIISADIE